MTAFAFHRPAKTFHDIRLERIRKHSTRILSNVSPGNTRYQNIRAADLQYWQELGWTISDTRGIPRLSSLSGNGQTFTKPYLYCVEYTKP